MQTWDHILWKKGSAVREREEISQRRRMKKQNGFTER